MTSDILKIEGLVIEARRPQDKQASTIVKGASLSIGPGETVAIIGESGAGKTTFALSTLAYARPGTRIVAGSISLDGEDILALDTPGRAMLRGNKVAYIAQSAQASFNPVISLGEQVAEAPVIHNILDQSAGEARAVELMDALHLPDPKDLASRYPFQVSGGQLQRVMIAMAMSCGPRLLVLDEPTTALDVTTQVEVLKLLRDIVKEQNIAALYVSHDLAVVAQVADRLIVMKDGDIVETGETNELLRNARHPYTQSLLEAVRVIPSKVKTGNDGGCRQPESPPQLLEILDMQAGYESPRLFAKPDPGQLVLKGVSLDLSAGEVLAVVGESGSGKTTLARVVAGLHNPVSGSMKFNGQIVPHLAGDRPRELLRGIQIIFQSPDLSLNPERRIGDILGRVRALYFNESRRQQANKVAELLESVSLPAGYSERFPNMISGGERQRVSIARALAAEPQLLICDEILSSLDTVVTTDMLELMRELRTRFSLAYLFVSHDLSTVAKISDRIAVVYAGHIVEVGRIADVFSPGHHPYTDVLLSSIPRLRTGWLDDYLIAQSPVSTGIDSSNFDLRGLCPFVNRCSAAIAGTCDSVPPPRQTLETGHDIYCHRPASELANDQTERERKLSAVNPGAILAHGNGQLF